MSAVAEASSLLREVAEPRPVGDTVKEAINRAARRVSKFASRPISASRVEDIWRQEARAVRAEEMDAIRKAAEARQQRQIEQEDRNEHTRLLQRLAFLEQRMATIDPGFAGAMVPDPCRQGHGPSGDLAGSSRASGSMDLGAGERG